MNKIKLKDRVVWNRNLKETFVYSILEDNTVLREHLDYNTIWFLKSKKWHTITEIECHGIDTYCTIKDSGRIFKLDCFDLFKDEKIIDKTIIKRIKNNDNLSIFKYKKQCKLKVLKEQKEWLESELNDRTKLEFEVRKELVRIKLAIINLEDENE